MKSGNAKRKLSLDKKVMGKECICVCHEISTCIVMSFVIHKVVSKGSSFFLILHIFRHTAVPGGS